MSPAPVWHRHHGFTLVELLVSTALGLMVLVAGFSALQGLLRAQRLGLAQAQMTEEASVLLAQLRLFLSQAATPKPWRAPRHPAAVGAGVASAGAVWV